MTKYSGSHFQLAFRLKFGMSVINHTGCVCLFLIPGVDSKNVEIRAGRRILGQIHLINVCYLVSADSSSPCRHRMCPTAEGGTPLPSRSRFQKLASGPSSAGWKLNDVICSISVVYINHELETRFELRVTTFPYLTSLGWLSLAERRTKHRNMWNISWENPQKSLFINSEFRHATLASFSLAVMNVDRFGPVFSRFHQRILLLRSE